MSNFDLSALALKAVCPNNDLLYDDKGMPSVMVKIPKMTLAQLGIGDSGSVHPAFIVNGREVDAVYISKYQNVVQNNRAYSLPGQDPKTSITFDGAISACSAKGEGWHCMTRAEWALLALWCKKNGTQPKGNNYYGKDSSESIYKAIPTYSSGGQTCRVATGTGPLSWSHDGTPSGIWDLNGNVYEWVGGMRTVYSELQVLVNNNAADSAHSQGASGTEWKAIDATTGEYVTPNGSGTTANTVKLQWLGNNHWNYGSTVVEDASGTYHGCPFESVTADNTIGSAAKEVLQALALLKADNTAGAYNDDYFYADITKSERSFGCGGAWDAGAAAGVFCCTGDSVRSAAATHVGFRSAYVNLPTE